LLAEGTAKGPSCHTVDLVVYENHFFFFRAVDVMDVFAQTLIAALQG